MPTQRPGFLAPNDPLLMQVANEIPVKEISSENIQKEIETMLKYAYGEQTDRRKPILVGLAAPQVGISQRIILVDIAADGHGHVADLKVYVNPEIEWNSPETAEWYEGCYSTSNVCGIVSRPIQIKIRAFDRGGKQVKEEYRGYTARIFQHEIDHLNGKEFVTHIKDPNKLHWVEEDEFTSYRDNEGWRKWTKKCSVEKWRQIKGI